MYSEKIQKLLASVTSKHDVESLPLWRQVPISQWSQHEIAGWFQYAARHIGIPEEEKEVILEDLSGRTGSDISNMVCQDFISLNERYGAMLFQSLHRDRRSGMNSVLQSSLSNNYILN